ncbi:MAG: DUF3623 domain-containing protein [Proteobacteria bacterium]|nr:DUF3623 domain-containing protein [Pseudomonadota bacterium]
MTTVADLGLFALVACFAWWISTGLILSLISRPEQTYRWSMLAMVVLAAIAGGVVMTTRETETVGSTIAAFGAAIVIWGLVEMAFLMGYVVGPRREACPPGLSRWARLKVCWEALAHHELALAGCLLLLFVAVGGSSNQIALQTFGLLWVMRLSAKFNIFLGVRNAGAEFLPPPLAHLKSYFAHAPMNPLFPLSVTGATVAVVALVEMALRPGAAAHASAGAALLATFAALALLEHWLLVLPVPATALWPWARSHSAEAPQSQPSQRLTSPVAAER